MRVPKFQEIKENMTRDHNLRVIDHDIVGFDVSMHNPVSMSEWKRNEQLKNNISS
jgi:hypothetical protein